MTFEVVRTPREIFVNGVEAESLSSSSRPIYTFPFDGQLYVIKLDIGGTRHWGLRDSHQSSAEIELFEAISESDYDFFIAPVAGEAIPFGVNGCGYIIQPYFEDLQYRVPKSDWEAIREVCFNYGITDVDPSEPSNCGYLPGEGRSVIYDWGMYR